MSSALEFGNQVRVSLSRLILQESGLPLSFFKVGVDLFLIAEVKGQGSVYLFQGQGGVTVYHAFRGHTLSKQIDDRVERDSCVPDSIDAFVLPYVLGVHRVCHQKHVRMVLMSVPASLRVVSGGHCPSDGHEDRRVNSPIMFRDGTLKRVTRLRLRP